MIEDFACAHTEKFFHGQRVKKFSGFERQAYRKLKLLDEVESLKELGAFPGNCLESLKGDRKGQYSIRVNKQWRICFVWSDEGPTRVEIVDYH